MCLHSSFFFFHDTAPTEIYTLSLHDALPISRKALLVEARQTCQDFCDSVRRGLGSDASPITDHRSLLDRKSTRLNSSHLGISYAVFCLKKKKTTIHHQPSPPSSHNQAPPRHT